MKLSKKVFSLFCLVALLLSSTANTQVLAMKNKLSLSELESITAPNQKLRLFAALDDLNQDFNNVTTAFPEIRLVAKTKGGKKRYKYTVYAVNGETRTILSTTDSKKKRNALPLGSFDGIATKNIEVEVQDKKGRVNVYEAVVNVANSPDTTLDTASNETDITLFTTCFSADNIANYEECLELFFRRVSFIRDDESATVTNDQGNFTVNLPAAAGAVGPAGPQGPPGPAGSCSGSCGEDLDIWSLDGNVVTNNGALGDYASQDLVFGDRAIDRDGQNKISFEKSTASFRAGATDNGQWAQRGNFTTVIGHNSNATENGAMSLGHLNKNVTPYTFLIGKHNEVNGGLLARYENKSTNETFTVDKQKTFIVGYKNTDFGGASYTVGAGNNNRTRNSVITGNSNSISVQISKEDSTAQDHSNSSASAQSLFTKAFNHVFGSQNRVGGESRTNSRSSGRSVSSSYNANFIAGNLNYIRHPGQRVYGSNNSVRGPYVASIWGNHNRLTDFSRTTVSGGNNIIIQGNSNSLRGRARHSVLDGSRNRVSGSTYWTAVYGQYNNVRCNWGEDCGGEHLIFGQWNTVNSNHFQEPTNSVQNAIIVGHGSMVNRDRGIAVGRFNLTNADNAITIGSGVSYGDDFSLKNERENTMALGVRSTKPAIVVTSSSTSETETGNVAIGDMLPQRKLHVSEAMRIEPQDAPPASPSLGDIYVDLSEAVCVFAAGIWNRIAGTGTCN